MSGEYKTLLDGTKTFLAAQTFSSTVVFQRRWHLDFSKENIGTGNYGYVGLIGNTRERESRQASLFIYRIGVYVVSKFSGLATIDARESRIEELVGIRDEIEESLINKQTGLSFEGFMPDPSLTAQEPFNAEQMASSIFESEIALGFAVVK